MKKFLESPANRTGVSACLATVLAALVQYLLFGTYPPVSDILGILIGVLAIIQPDNSATVGQLEKAVIDLRSAMAVKTPTSIETVASDVLELPAGNTRPESTN